MDVMPGRGLADPVDLGAVGVIELVRYRGTNRMPAAGESSQIHHG